MNHLAELFAAGPRRLLILDDVWYPDQQAAFPVSGSQCARLVTTRVSSLVAGECVPVRVDQVTSEQARALLAAGLPALPPALVAALVAQTGRWPLLLRLLNKVLVEQVKTDLDVAGVARELLERLRSFGALQVDQLTGAAEQQLNVDDPQQRQQAVTATIEASTGLLPPVDRTRFAELAIFAEDEIVPVSLVAQLWQASGGLDPMATRALCARLGELALLNLTGTATGGVVSLHDVVRDFLREELGQVRLVELHQMLLQAGAGGLPGAQSAVPDGGADDAKTAWWELAESERYLWDHLIEHLVAAEQIEEADALAGDLR